MSKSVKELALSWVEKTSTFFAILGFVYLGVYALEVTRPLGQSLTTYLELASWVIWIAFAVDLLARLVASKNFRHFLKSSWLEILALMLPFMRILRVFRVILAIKGLKFLAGSRLAATGTYLILLLPISWFAGAIAVLDAESQIPGAPISDLQSAMWWALTTIATVGYGDLYPLTGEGKFVAALLMLTGIGLFSASAGIFASWIMGGTNHEEK
jgi:voltage-gated potassium channel